MGNVLVHSGESRAANPVEHFEFVDVGQPHAFQVLNQLEEEPKYRTRQPGVSSEGFCTNPSCPVHDRRFICNHGYGLYRLNKDLTECPVCRQASPEALSFGFSNAKVAIRSSAVHENVVKVRNDLVEAEGKYMTTVPQMSENSERYEFVEIFSSDLESTPPLGNYSTCATCSRTLVPQVACEHGHVPHLYN